MKYFTFTLNSVLGDCSIWVSEMNDYYVLRVKMKELEILCFKKPVLPKKWVQCYLKVDLDYL